eukprot:420456-Prorocentrum_minimum.AAC.1
MTNLLATATQELLVGLKESVEGWLEDQWLEEKVEGCIVPARSWPASVVLNDRVSRARHGH